jgi:catechol-2,3-dioxygenase
VPINRLNHAVFYVRDAERTASFYEQVLGFVRIVRDEQNRYAFLRAPGSSNHHDLALFTIGSSAGPSTAGVSSVGTYHVAWEVPTLADLDDMRDRLAAAGALVGSSDHAVNKSLYAKDPDGLEFEVMWLTPQERWGDDEHEAIVRPLDLAGDMVRFGADTVSRS